MRDRMQTIVVAAATAMVTAMLVSAVNAIADSNPGTDQVAKLIPYQGTLEKDGVAVTGSVSLVFQLFDGAAAATPVWDEQLAVQAYAGRFSALLGSSTAAKATALGKALTDADDLYLAVQVVTAGGNVPLSNRQRFLPVPYAMWTTAATDFKVGKDLSVAGAAVVTGSATIGGSTTLNGTLTAKQDATFKGNVSLGSSTLGATLHNQAIEATPSMLLNTDNNADIVAGGKIRMEQWDLLFSPVDTSRGDGGRALVLNGGEVLTLNFGGDFAGGTRVQGANLVVDGAFESGRMTCRAGCADVQWIEAPGGNGWGSWKGRTYCPSYYYVCGIEQRVEGALGDGDDTSTNSIAMVCCPF